MAFDLKACIDSLQPPAIHTFLGGKIESIQQDEWQAVISYQPRPEFANPMGQLQGGMLCSMLDDAMGLFAMLAQEGAPSATVMMNISFLRPCQLQQVEVRVSFVRQGRRISNIEAVAYQHAKAVAKATAAFTPV